MIFWISVVLAISLVYLAIAKQTGFSMLSTADGTPRFAVPKGLNGILKPGTISKWWDNLDKESSPGKQFVTLVAALLLAYAEFRMNGTVWAALVLILVAAIISPPKSAITKAFVYLDLIIIAAAAFLPGAAEMRTTSYEIAKIWTSNKSKDLSQYAANLKNGTAPEATQAPAKISTKKLTLTSGWSEAIRPPISGGAMKFYCTEPGSQMKIEFDSAQETLVAPGESFACPLPGQGINVGKMYVNARYYFRSDQGGHAIVENGF